MNKYMNQALKNAKKSLENDEVPIGCVIVKNDKIIAQGSNMREETNSVIAHAEIKAIEEASVNLGTWKLDDCELYVTIEPCIMCMGAIIQSRIKKIYIGAKQDINKPSTYRKYITNSIPVEVDESFLNKESEELMLNFFKKMRTKRR